MSTISIEGMRFWGYHGCFAEETIIGTGFLANFYFDTDTTEAETTDDLSKTINYQTVYTLLKEEMSIPSKLIEHVARRMMDKVCKEFPQISDATLKLTKLNPPLGGQMQGVSITIKK